MKRFFEKRCEIRRLKARSTTIATIVIAEYIFVRVLLPLKIEFFIGYLFFLLTIITVPTTVRITGMAIIMAV